MPVLNSTSSGSKVRNGAARGSRLNPQAILERGYSIARDEQGKVVRDGGALQVGSEVGLTFEVGVAKAKVVSKSR